MIWAAFCCNPGKDERRLVVVSTQRHTRNGGLHAQQWFNSGVMPALSQTEGGKRTRIGWSKKCRERLGGGRRHPEVWFHTCCHAVAGFLQLGGFLKIGSPFGLAAVQQENQLFIGEPA